MKKFKKLLAVILAMVMIVSLMPLTVANAADDAGALELNVPVTLCGDGTTAVFTFTPESTGWYVFRSEGGSDPYARLFNSDFDEIDFDDDFSEYNFTIASKLYEGYSYILEVESWVDDFEEFTVVVEETIAAESVEIMKEPDNTTVVEGYEYETLDYTGLELEFTMTDGTKVYWTEEEHEAVGYEYVTIEESQDGQGHYYIDISCGEAFSRFFFTTIENPIESIDYISEEEISYYVNTNGMYDDDLGYFVYYADIPEDAKVRVNYYDGTSETFEFYGDVFFDYYSKQDETPWTVGTNYMYISHLGVETEVPVEILPCPFVNVTLNSAPTTKYCFGDSRYGYMENEDNYYVLYPDNMKGISFTVEFEDGTTKTYTEEDFDNTGLLDGYEFSVDAILCDGLDTYEATLNYLGYALKYDVEVIKSPVLGLELSDAPDVYEYDGYFYPVFDGAQIRLTLADGTERLIDITEENTSYNCYYGGIFEYVFTDGEYEVYAGYKWDEELGEYYTLNCLGYEYGYFGIDFIDAFRVESVEFSNVSLEGFSAVVTDTDGNVHEFDMTSTLTSFKVEGYAEGYSMTDEGILYYMIMEEKEGYNIWFMGDDYFIPYEEPVNYILGDVNGDSDVAIVDATLVQRHVAKLDTLEGTAALAADVNQDGDIAIVDATLIQRFVAKIIDEF